MLERANHSSANEWRERIFLRPLPLALAVLLAVSITITAARSQEGRVRVTDKPDSDSLEGQSVGDDETEPEATIQNISLLQPQTFVPAPPPRLNAQPTTPPTSDVARDYGHSGLRPSRVGQARQGTRPTLGYTVPASDAPLRASTDAGNHVGKSPAAPPVWTQQRNPVVSDSRISGSRVGRIAGSGSYWVPARIDLDTMLNKLDSRTVGGITVIPGPYTTRLGPDFQFYNVDMLPSPRADSSQYGGSTGFEFKSNGEQWLGRQTVYGADTDWGIRLGYNHRVGNDYETGGDHQTIPSSYNSRTFDVAIGRDITVDQHIEFHVLRLDQTNVEMPGQAFDIDFLVTNGYEVEYLLENAGGFERVVTSAWYNDTRLHGSAQRPAKRRQFPFLNAQNYVGTTDVQAMSTGYRLEGVSAVADSAELTLGTDLRYLRQGLDEFSQGVNGVVIYDGNSPIPRSFSANPGLFLEYTNSISDTVRLTGGARLDFVGMDVVDDPTKLASLGLASPPQSLSQLLGSDDFQRSYLLGSAFVMAEGQVTDKLVIFAGAGHAERPPTATELYAAGSFLFLLQNGLNAVTGDPTLNPERLWQTDLGLRFNDGRMRGSVRGYHAWIDDYITFRNNGVFDDSGVVQQVDLKYVNTQLATLAGVDLTGEYDLSDMLTAFGNLAYVDGRNRNAVGGGGEALPMMPPLKSRLGGRLHAPTADPHWGLEVSTQVVAPQNRVAASLLEFRTPGYSTWDVRTFWEPTPKVSLYAGVENLFDKSYRSHFDFQSANGIQVRQPGSNVYLGAETRY